jgi:hypothetical protein
MFKVTAQLTNVKAPRNDEGTITTTPTDGNMRLSPKAAQVLGLGHGDYINGVQGENEQGEPVMAVHKGIAGDEDRAAVGAKLASPSQKPGSSLNFSSSNFYEKLGGGKGMNRVWKVDAENAVTAEGVTYFPLTFLREEEQQERNSKAEGETVDTAVETELTAQA